MQELTAGFGRPSPGLWMAQGLHTNVCSIWDCLQTLVQGSWDRNRNYLGQDLKGAAEVTCLGQPGKEKAEGALWAGWTHRGGQWRGGAALALVTPTGHEEVERALGRALCWGGLGPWTGSQGSAHGTKPARVQEAREDMSRRFSFWKSCRELSHARESLPVWGILWFRRSSDSDPLV